MVDVTMEDNIEADYNTSSDIRDYGGTYTCGTTCSAGQFSNCKAATGNLLDTNPCYVSCGTCTDCPAGTANSANHSTTFDACEECAPGYASSAGALACTECEVRVSTKLAPEPSNPNPTTAAAKQPFTTNPPPFLGGPICDKREQ